MPTTARRSFSRALRSTLWAGVVIVAAVSAASDPGPLATDPTGLQEERGRGVVAAGLPRIQVSDTVLQFVAKRFGALPPNESFILTNQTGVGLMDWLISSDRGWLGASPSAGRSNEVEIQVWMAHTSVVIGLHVGHLVISSDNAINAPDTVFVRLDMQCPIDLTGDTNHDGVINQTDVIYLVIHVTKGGPPPQPLREAGDVNCNGLVNLTDVVFLANFVFKAGPSPCNACSML